MSLSGGGSRRRKRERRARMPIDPNDCAPIKRMKPSKFPRP